MVVGDRLWLFSQPPHGPPAPIQSLLLNNVPPAPQHMPSLHPSVLSRSYGSPTAPQIMQRSNQGYNLATSPQSPHFVNKQMRFDYFNKMQFSPYGRNPGEPVDFRFGSSKTVLKSSENIEGEPNSSELASLESRFGASSTILNEQNNKFQDAINVNEDTRSSSTNSEIDCEEIET